MPPEPLIVTSNVPNDLDKDKCYVLHHSYGDSYWIVWYENDKWQHDKGTIRKNPGVFSLSTYHKPCFELVNSRSETWTLLHNYSNLPSYAICGECLGPIRYGTMDYLCEKCRA